jgi:hypothetical protein
MKKELGQTAYEVYMLTAGLPNYWEQETPAQKHLWKITEATCAALDTQKTIAFVQEYLETLVKNPVVTWGEPPVLRHITIKSGILDRYLDATREQIKQQAADVELMPLQKSCAWMGLNRTQAWFAIMVDPDRISPPAFELLHAALKAYCDPSRAALIGLHPEAVQDAGERAADAPTTLTVNLGDDCEASGVYELTRFQADDLLAGRTVELKRLRDAPPMIDLRADR